MQNSDLRRNLRAACVALTALPLFFAFLKAPFSYLVHNHHGLGEHTHHLEQASDFSNAKWHEQDAHFKSVHSDLPEENIPSNHDDNLPEPITVASHLPINLFHSAHNAYEHDIPEVIRYKEVLPASLGETVSRRLFSILSPRSGAPPPGSNIARILLSNHALLI